MELVTGSGVYIKLLDLVNVYYRTKNAISAARRLLICVFNDQTLMERSVKGSPDRPGLCPITHQAILGRNRSIHTSALLRCSAIVLLLRNEFNSFTVLFTLPVQWLCIDRSSLFADCVEMISLCKPPEWAADEAMINRSLIVRLCELRTKRTAKIYVTSQPNPTAHPPTLPDSYLT